MESYEGPAKVVQGDNSFDVHCAYLSRTDSSSGRQEWSGAYQAREAPPWPDVGEATLQLPDGATGTIMISFAAVNPNPQRATFQGSGPSPHS